MDAAVAEVEVADEFDFAAEMDALGEIPEFTEDTKLACSLANPESCEMCQ